MGLAGLGSCKASSVKGKEGKRSIWKVACGDKAREG